MNLEACNNVVLVVADNNFANWCVNATEYVSTFKTRMVERRGTPLNFLTVKGKYGINSIDGSIPVLETVDDRTKTLFAQTLENNSMMFDELVVISVSDTDPYILAARDVVTNANKTATQYQYSRKQ